MALYERIIFGTPDETVPVIPVHQFMALLREFARGESNKAEIISIFGLRTEDEADLDALINKATSLATDRRFEFASMIHDTLLLAENGDKYTTRADFFARVSRFT